MNAPERQVEDVPCPECGGLGRDELGECEHCQGNGYVEAPIVEPSEQLRI